MADEPRIPKYTDETYKLAELAIALAKIRGLKIEHPHSGREQEGSLDDEGVGIGDLTIWAERFLVEAALLLNDTKRPPTEEERFEKQLEREDAKRAKLIGKPSLSPYPVKRE
jgi:hypothetical protein